MMSETVIKDHIFHEIRKPLGFKVSNIDDDFLPIQTEFAVANRDRAFSWDVNFEEGLHSGVELLQALHDNSQTSSSIFLQGSTIIVKKEQQSNVKDADLKGKSQELKLSLKLSSPIAIKLESDRLIAPALGLIDDLSEPCNDNVDDTLGDIFPLENDPNLDLGDDCQKSESRFDAKLKYDLVLKSFQSVPVEHDRRVDIKLSENDIVNGKGAPEILCPNLFSTDRRVGVYTKEERKQRILRFRQKKLNRIWKKQIKYDCRKRLADTRPRVKGRFVSRSSPEHESTEQSTLAFPAQSNTTTTTTTTTTNYLSPLDLSTYKDFSLKRSYLLTSNATVNTPLTHATDLK